MQPWPEPPARRETLVDCIGWTPLLRLRRLEPPGEGVELWAKAEWYNPGGSVKDRAALGIVQDARQRGLLGSGRRLLDATSGNTGISYAMLGAVLSFGVTLVIPGNAGIERKKILSAYGAEVVLTDPMQGMDLAIETAQAMCSLRPGDYFYADQYSNPANWRAHYDTTALEILSQTRGRVTHFVAGLGTSGTFVGTTRRLREARPEIRCVAFVPDSPYHGLEGLKHMPTARVPAIYDPSLADTLLEVSTEAAYAMVLRLAREEGLLVGMSAGAAVAATLEVVRRDGAGSYVTILPDGGAKYLSEPLFDLGIEAASPGGPA